jgi:peptidoglycan/LPS O-acetylase OafA/YrhL
MSISFYSLIVASIVTVFSFSRSSDRSSFLRLDQTGTLHLKGFAILLVLLSHLANLKLITLPGMFKFAGAWGVALFLILSGYGLTQSYLKDGIGSNFLGRRFKKVLIPYAVVTGLWILIGVSTQGADYSLSTIALSLTGLDLNYTIDPTMWFVTFIALWYFVFYVVFKFPVNDILKIGVLFGLAYAFKSYALNTGANRVLWQWTLHVYAFPAGVLLGLAYRRVSFVFSSYATISFLAVAGAASLFVFGRYVAHSLTLIDFYSRANIAFALAAISVMIIVRHLGLQSRLLAFFGFMSYEIYLLEWMLMAKFDLPHAFSSTFIGVPVFLAILVVSGITLHYVLAALTTLTDEYVSISFTKRAARRCYAQIHAWTEVFYSHKENLPALNNLEKEIINR